MVEVQTGGHERHRRRRWPWVLGIVCILGIVLVVDAWTAASSGRASLLEARDRLRTGAGQLESGDVAAARRSFEEAADASQAAVDSLGHPGVAVVGVVPALGDDVDAARRLGRASGLASEAGIAVADAAAAAGWDGGSLPGFAPGGRLDVDVFERAAPDLASASELARRAADEVATIDPATLIEPLQGPASTAIDEIGRRSTQAERMADAVDLLPGLLGAHGDRTYLLVSFNTSDPRGSGGYPGGYALLRVDGRRIRIDGFRPTNEIPSVPPVQASPETERRWKVYGSLTDFWNTTYVPDFPTAAGLMTSIWGVGGGEPVDGVIGVDPAMMAGLLEVVGPVSTPDWPEKISASNVERILGRDTFMTQSQVESDAWQVDIGTALWTAALGRPWPGRQMMEAIGEAAAGRHLMVSVNDRREAALLGALGADGAVRFPPEPGGLVVVEGYTANRAGYFADILSETAVTEAEDGSQEVTITVTMQNYAPAPCPKSILCGNVQGRLGGPLGSFGALVHVYLPEGAEKVKVTADGTPWQLPLQHEFGRPVAIGRLFAPPGDSSVTEIRYRVA